MSQLAAVGCGKETVGSRVTAYRTTVETILEAPSLDPTSSDLTLPARRDRRLEVGDQRIGPFDFLSILGCPLSELVAARNSALGKVLVPTRRLAHEFAVLEAMDDCLPTLSAERAERLRAHADTKRAELPSHIWNAVWLNRELERFLSTAPAALIGSGDPADGPKQIERAAEALDRGDIDALESALHALRDDPPVGRLLIDLKTVTEELERTVRLISAVSAQTGGAKCDAQARRLTRVFASTYSSFQPALGKLDRNGRRAVDALESLFQATLAGNESISAPMQRYRRMLLGDVDTVDVASRFRNAVVEHAKAWGPLLERCGVAPGRSV